MNALTLNIEEQLNTLGFQYTPQELKSGDNKILELKGMSVTADMLTLINNTQKQDAYVVSGAKQFTERVLRCKKLVFQPSGTLNWDLNNFNADVKDIIIAADEIVLNAPASATDTSHIKLISPFANAPFLGTAPEAGIGGTGPAGYSPQGETGQSGGHGGAGLEGNAGITYQYPVLNIFYKSIKVNTANPTLIVALNIEAEGINGGKGGKGGTGGRGGDGARGSAGETENVGGFLPIKVCKAGPGQGGSAGWAGQGGKGGQAGKGGDGASIAFVGPKSSFDKIENIDFFLNKGMAGLAGDAGEAGQLGQPGGGGSKPFECVSGAQPGTGGGYPNPLNLGVGATNVDGTDGILYYLERSNTDI